MNREKVIIMGAAGRDFHNFNVCFRGNERYEVIAFTATQIPEIEDRRYPPELAGPLYPQGIPIYPEEELTDLIMKNRVDLVVFSYSDVSHEHVMHRGSEAVAAGAHFMLLGSSKTMLKSKVPVVAICAVRTGCGKSQTTRRVCQILRSKGKRIAVVRHPMPYGNLVAQRMQRFERYADLTEQDCTIEEREEYEPHLDMGNIVYAGVDYGEILAKAQEEAEIIVWDGGNNDLPFFKPDVLIVVTDPLRPGHEVRYFPGEASLRMADAVVINKQTTAGLENIETVRANVHKLNPKADIVDAASPIYVEDSHSIRGKKVLVVEDGPTLTHGEMTFGAGVVAAKKYDAAEIVDPRPYIVGSIMETFETYPSIGPILPAMGYGKQQIKDLEKTINKVPCDAVVIGTPIDLRRVIRLNKPAIRIHYELQEIGRPSLEDILNRFFDRK